MQTRNCRYIYRRKRKDGIRVHNRELKSSKAGLNRRKKLRAIRKGFVDIEKELEVEN